MDPEEKWTDPDKEFKKGCGCVIAVVIIIALCVIYLFKSVGIW